MRRWLLPLLPGLAALVLGVYFGLQKSGILQTDVTATDNQIQAHLADIQLPDILGISQSGGQWQGQVVVVNHWASWCPPCVKEIPMLIEFQQRFADKGVQIVGIAHDTTEAARIFGDQVGINYPSLVITSGGSELMIRQGNPQGSALPFTAVFDRNGNLAANWLGVLESDQLMELVQEHL